MTIIQTDRYSFHIADAHIPATVALIIEDSARAHVQEALDATEPGDPVVLPLSVADALLNADAEREREQETKYGSDMLDPYDYDYLDYVQEVEQS